jgi:hypothetical protein
MCEIKQFRLETKTIGSLPIVNYFIKRIGLDDILERYLNTANTSRNILVQTFQTELLAKQVEVLRLAGVPLEEYYQEE